MKRDDEQPERQHHPQLRGAVGDPDPKLARTELVLRAAETVRRIVDRDAR
jgi:hypothetical protein